MKRFYLILAFFFLYLSFKATQLWPMHQFLAIFIMAAFLVLSISNLFVLRSKPEVFDRPWFQTYSWISFIFMGLLTTFLIFSLPVDLIYGVFRQEQISQNIALTVLGLSTLVAIAGLFQARIGPTIKDVHISKAGMNSALQGFKIVQISDLHVGPTIRANYTQSVVDRANAVHADIIVITGDLIDGPTESVAPHLEPLKNLKAKYGVFYVTGNHEYYWQPASLIEAVRKLGIKPLINENEVIAVGSAKILVAGVTDPMGTHTLPGHAPDIQKAARTNQNTDFKLLLAHRPDVFDEAKAGGFDMLLAGHTHAGQFFPFSLFIGLAHKYYAGLHQEGNHWIYVNQGTGYWGPVNRFAIPAEVTVLQLN
ncbi:MAG: metallophosphoesterase [Bdellovibrionota bacterium]